MNQMGWKSIQIFNRIKGNKGDYEGLSLKLENGPSDFVEVWPKVSEYGLSSFATNGYTWKNLDLKIIQLIPLRTIGLRKL